MGKLGAVVPDATAVVAELADDGSAVNGPEDLPDWDSVRLAAPGGAGRRPQQRIFKAEQEGNRKQVRTCRNCCCAAGLTRLSACAGSRSITLAAAPPESTGRSR